MLNLPFSCSTKKKCVGNARQGNLDWLSIQMPTCLDAFLLYGIVETFSGFGEKGILEHQLGLGKKKKSFSAMEITRGTQRSEMHFVNVEIKLTFIFNKHVSLFVKRLFFKLLTNSNNET